MDGRAESIEIILQFGGRLGVMPVEVAAKRIHSVISSCHSIRIDHRNDPPLEQSPEKIPQKAVLDEDVQYSHQHEGRSDLTWVNSTSDDHHWLVEHLQLEGLSHMLGDGQ
jgi:hypothetical protein